MNKSLFIFLPLCPLNKFLEVTQQIKHVILFPHRLAHRVASIFMNFDILIDDK